MDGARRSCAVVGRQCHGPGNRGPAARNACTAARKGGQGRARKFRQADGRDRRSDGRGVTEDVCDGNRAGLGWRRDRRECHEDQHEPSAAGHGVCANGRDGSAEAAKSSVAGRGASAASRATSLAGPGRKEDARGSRATSPESSAARRNGRRMGTARASDQDVGAESVDARRVAVRPETVARQGVACVTGEGGLGMRGYPAPWGATWSVVA